MDLAHHLLMRRHWERRRRARRLAVHRRDAALMRQLRDASNPFEMPEAKFLGKYRLSRQVVRNLVEELRPHMRATQRITSVPNHLKVLTALHFFGHGSDQKSIGADNAFSLSQPSVSLCLSEVVAALNAPAFMRAHIKFPDTVAERRFIIQRNFRRSSIPGVLGYVDGAHMLIIAPTVHEEQYVNRHQTHSLNVQVTCDSDMVILNIVARYPGVTNDSFIWANSAIRAKMEQLYRGGEQCWLIADSGYPQEPWIHVPFDNPAAGSREHNYNQAHMTDRSVVERTIGHLRNRFRCLHKHRVLEYDPVKAGRIVNACVCLHNMSVRAHVPPPDSESDDSEDDPDYPPVAMVQNGRARDRLLIEARAVRQGIATRVPQLPPRQPYNPRRLHRRN